MLKLNRRKIIGLAKLALPVIAVALVTPSYATEKRLSGQAAYEKFCASCHGETGKGDGPIAANLEPTPNDLTIIAKWNNGVFPFNEVYKIIDGRGGVRSEDSGQMPVWGEHFEGSLHGDDVIRDLTMYLESIQEK